MKQNRKGAIDQALDQMFEDEEAAMRELQILEDELFGTDNSITQAPVVAKTREYREKERPGKMRDY